MIAGSERFRLLFELGVAFASRIELAELVPLVFGKCREVLDAEGVSVLLIDHDRNEFYFPYVEQDPEIAAQLRTLRLPADRGIAGAVASSGVSERIDDVASDPRFYDNIDRNTGFTSRSLLCVPLRGREQVVGVLQVVNRRDGGAFTDEDLRFLEALGASIAVAFENAGIYGRVKASVERLKVQVGALRLDLARADRFADMVGTSPAMDEVFRLMESASASTITVLIEGETGAGKELVARGIHRASARAEAPFIAVNCAAVPETLLESQLFGHRKGSFTGALTDQRGLFEAADGGTIFLDEIGEMPASMQAKLLRVLQEGEIMPVGEIRPRKIDVRVISATNRDLQAEIAKQAFREDLYYRLAVFPIRVPALRDRREDVPLLVERLLGAVARRQEKEIAGVEPEALAQLAQFDWPGNVRELYNEIERAVALAKPGETIGLSHLSAKVTGAPAGISPALSSTVDLSATDGDNREPAGDLRAARAAFEAAYISRALGEFAGNVSRTARALGLSRVMLQRKMKEYNLR